MERFRYRLTETQKQEIAENLIISLNSNEKLSRDSVLFVTNWILTGPDEKVKAFFDVWDIVLKNYLPESRPILFRSCNRRSTGKIASFTGRLEAARRFSKRTGFLIICDTNEALRMAHLDMPGDYQNSFFPLAQLMEKDAKLEDPRIPTSIYERYKGEDEYIMRVNLDRMELLKWCPY